MLSRVMFSRRNYMQPTTHAVPLAHTLLASPSFLVEYRSSIGSLLLRVHTHTTENSHAQHGRTGASRAHHVRTHKHTHTERERPRQTAERHTAADRARAGWVRDGQTMERHGQMVRLCAVCSPPCSGSSGDWSEARASSVRKDLIKVFEGLKAI